MLGDATNLIGSILTDQLMFQVFIATYFCLIDMGLIAQYLYYSGRNPPPPLRRQPSRSASRRSQISEAMRHSQIYSDPRFHTASLEERPPLLPEDRIDASTSTLRSPLHRFPSDSSIAGLKVDNQDHGTASQSHYRSQSRPRASKSLILFSFWALFGLGVRHVSRSDSSSTLPQAEVWHSTLTSPPQPSLSLLDQVVLQGQGHHKGHLPDNQWDYKIIIGRISSWTCATLYLTSRMPQIWKNFRRQSVDGLSTYLFLAALSGNATYVASILTNPLIKSDPTFLPESIPFLVGSGGTVAFDVTILFQCWIYNRARRLRHRKKARRRAAGDAEENGPLLSSDEEDHEENNRRRGRRPLSRRREHSGPSTPRRASLESLQRDVSRSVSAGRRISAIEVPTTLTRLEEVPEPSSLRATPVVP